jgi:hypothetical protein
VGWLGHSCRLVVVLVAVLALVTGGSAAASSGPTGGAGLGSSSTHKKATSKKKKKRSKPKPRSSDKTPSRTSDPFAGRGMWLWYVSASNGGNLSSIISQAHAYGITTLMIKAGDGSSAWSQFNAPLVSALHAAGLRVCAWQYVYGTYPATEAKIGAAAVHDGADCLLIDAESEYEGKYLSAQTYITDLRAAIGANFPVALASFPYVDYHPSLPYSVFLGPGGAQFNTPQMYWQDIGTTVDAVYQHTMSYNQVYGRTVIPLGQVYSNPPASAIMRFRLLSRAYGTPGVSWWDWQDSHLAQWRALAKPAKWLTNFTSPASAPIIGQGAKGDLVVWAQEHMLTAGLSVAINGKYNAAFTTEVQAFQTAHGLTADGVIGPQTWGALLQYAPAKVLWSSKGAVPATPTASSSVVHAARAGATLRLPVPATAALKAKRYEIPAHLGRG